jgi:hypothetical protein
MVKIKYNCYNCNSFCEDTLSKIINHIDNDTCEKCEKYCLLSKVEIFNSLDYLEK